MFLTDSDETDSKPSKCFNRLRLQGNIQLMYKTLQSWVIILPCFQMKNNILGRHVLGGKLLSTHLSQLNGDYARTSCKLKI